MSRHPGAFLPCVHRVGHGGEHRSLQGYTWEDCLGLVPPPERRWYAYDTTTGTLWRWNGPDHKGFIAVGHSKRKDLALKAHHGQPFVELGVLNWLTCYSVNPGDDMTLLARLVTEWYPSKADAEREEQAEAILSALIPNQHPDPRPDPSGPCSFCETPAMRWCRDYAVCHTDHCNAAEFFHVERLTAGSVDTPETRAESRRYAVHYLAGQAEAEAQKKPEGSCGFCREKAETPNVEGTVATCRKHEREGWRLHYRLETGGVFDSPALRAEVLRQVARDGGLLREGQRDATGARTERDHPGTPVGLDGNTPPLSEWPTDHLSSISAPRAPAKPPPEEIPLVGITPHYEWP